MKLSQLAGALEEPEEEEAPKDEGLLTSSEAPEKLISESGRGKLQKKVERISEIREDTKGMDFSEGEPVTEGEDPGLLRMLEAAGVPVEERQAAHSLLREPPGPTSLSGLAQKQPVADPSFSLVESPNTGFGITDVVNFLIGDEMGIIGMKYDNNGFGWDLEVAQKQWAEEPLWVNLLATASLAGSIAFPAVAAVRNSIKFGAKGLSKIDEIAKWKALGAIDEAVPPEEVTSATLSMLRRLEDARIKHLDFEAKKLAEMEGRLEAGLVLPSGRTMGEVEKLKWKFDKNFTNTYFEQINSIAKDGHVKKEFVDNLDSLWKNERLGRFFVDMPDASRGQAIYANLMVKSGKVVDFDAAIKAANPGIADADVIKIKNSLRLSPEEQRWADTMFDAMKAHQDEALKEGFITPETLEKMGKVHLPAFTKDTALDAASSRTLALPITGGKMAVKHGEPAQKTLQVFNFPRLDAPQIRHRGSEIGTVAERLFKGELMTDPDKMTFAGYVTDRLLLNNFKFIRDHAIKYGRSHDDIIKVFGDIDKAEKAGWVSLSKLRNGVPEVEATLRRMLKASGNGVADDAALPFIHKSHFEAMFGKGGLFEQTQNAANLLHLLTVIHKTSKTVFNLPTHMNNWVGNFSFLAMAGYNPLAPQNLSVMQDTTKAFIKWAKAHDGLAKTRGTAKSLYNPATRRLKGVDLGTIKIGDKTFNLNEEFLDPMVKEIIGEESAFLHAEGLAVVEAFLQSAKKGSFNEKFASAMLKAKDSTKFTQRTFDYMTKAYLGEDVVPKMAYYLDLRAKGVSKEWAVLEVGRRLPVYSTVGQSIQQARRIWVPWATFPAEATRIIKNNIMDNPISTLPWLHLPSLLQTGFAASGLGPSTADEVKERKRQLPVWAQTPVTVIVNDQGAEVGARAGMGIVGASIGAAAGGPRGALLGGIVGAALPPEASAAAMVGGAAGAFATGSPLGAAAGASIGAVAGIASKWIKEEQENDEQLRGAVLRWLPWSALTPKSNSPDYVWDLQGTIGQLPVEPLAILRPAVEVMAGRTSFGQEIPSEGPVDMAGKMFAGVLGMLMPPIFQKYGFKITTPDQPITQAVFGREIPGDITNVSRFKIDSGHAIDPLSGSPGNPTFDLFMNNTNGIWQSYAIKPEVRLLNEARQESALKEIRSYYGKQLAYYAQNNDWDAATAIIEKVFSTYSRQYAADPAMAQEKFSEWMQRYVKSFGKHPGLRNMSEEELMARFELASKQAKEMRSEARRDIMRAIERERQIRQSNDKKPKFLY